MKAPDPSRIIALLYSPWGRQQAWRLTGDAEQAKELVQDAAVRLLGTLERCPDTVGRPYGLVRIVLQRAAINRHRKRTAQSRREDWIVGDTPQEASVPATEPISPGLRRALDGLQPLARRILALHAEGYTAEQIRPLLPHYGHRDVSIRTVRRCLDATRTRLRRLTEGG